VSKSAFAILIAICFGQQAEMFRVGDVFRGAIKQVRSETVLVKKGDDGAVIEGPRILVQIINYSDNGLARELFSYRGGSLQTKTVETFLPGGNRESVSVYNAELKLTAKTVYEYDPSGRLLSEVQYSPDGSINERREIQSNSAAQFAITKTTGNGSTVETSINSRDSATGSSLPVAKRSVWTTTKADGSRTENIHAVDASGNHNDQVMQYTSNGTLLGRSVSITNASITRLERTEYDAADNIKIHSLETREYDSRHNLTKITNYRWNPSRQEFEPFAIAYHTIEYAR
jgi:antitoxin component YwqK of YwqJK toxin-antitoxin module